MKLKTILRTLLVMMLIIMLISIFTVLKPVEFVQQVILGQSSNNSSSSDIKIVLNYYTWEVSEKDNPIFKEFSKLHPNIEVKINLIAELSTSIKSKLDVIAMGGGEMDIWPLTDGTQFTEIKRGLVRKLDDYIKRDKIEMHDFFGSSAKSAYFNGSYYGLPYRASVQMVFYNKDMFDDAGVPYPTDDWTYEDFYNIAKKVTKGGENSGDRRIYGLMQNWFMITGGRPGNKQIPFYNSDGLSSFSEQEYWRKTLKLLKKMQDEGIMMPLENVKARDTFSSIELLSGRAAMTWGASWVVRDIKDKESFPINFRVGCVLPPRVDKSTENIPQTTLVESILGIPETSKHPDEAWEFIRFYVENGSENTAKTGNVPLYIPAYNFNLISAFISGSGLTFEDGKRFFSVDSLHYDFIPKGIATTEYADTIRDECGKYFSNRQSLDQTLKKIKIEADRAILKERSFLKYKN